MNRASLPRWQRAGCQSRQSVYCADFRHGVQLSAMASPSLRIDRYILDGHEPIRCQELATWAAWMESPHRLLQDSQFIDSAHNRVRVCTTFLGADVNFGDGDPVLFETMILGGPCDRALYRYCTWEEAEEGHNSIVERCKLRDVRPNDQPLVFKAEELAQRTVKKASHIAITSLIERSFKNHPPVR